MLTKRAITLTKIRKWWLNRASGDLFSEQIRDLDAIEVKSCAFKSKLGIKTSYEP